MKTKLEIQTIESMKSLGIYEPEFDTMISIYCSLIEQYRAIEKDFKKSKFEVMEKTGYSDNRKKNPMVGSMEALRKDILNYSNALGLTPSGLRKIKSTMKETKKLSKLEQALSNFGS
jgi:P27 family predicted phage terminase small subunit